MQRKLALHVLLAICALCAIVAQPAAAIAAPSTAVPSFVPPGKPYQVPTGTPFGRQPPGPVSTLQVQGKVDSAVATVARANREGGAEAAKQSARQRGLTVVGDTVRVVVESARGLNRGDAKAAVVAHGGAVEGEYADLVQAIVPTGGLEALAAQPDVRRVRQPARAEPTVGATLSEGVGTTNAAEWQKAGLSGAGVKIAIIDVGFMGLPTAQASGDVPGVVATNDLCSGQFSTADNHGTAVAEIVSDMAPGAQLYLACVNTEVSLGMAKDWAKAQGAQVINNSMAWFDATRGDGTGGPGTPDSIVADANASGILWVGSAGNYAQNHWSGSLSGPDQFGFMLFPGGSQSNAFIVAPNDTQCVFLKWDLWPTTNQDYDLYIGDPATGQFVASSLNDQASSPQAPYEAACVTNPTASFKQYDALVAQFQATVNPPFDLMIPSAAAVEFVVAAGSIVTPAESPSAFAVGAYCWQNNALESFSSQGPTIDGRTKPDIGGPDQVSTQTYGPFGGNCANPTGFPGTSAAAPHVAGAAALVKQANPGFGPAQLRSFLTSHAQDSPPPGVDNQLGAGRLFLGPSPQPTFSANPAPGSQIALTALPGVFVSKSISVTNTGQTGTVLTVSASSLSAGYSLTGAPLQLAAGAGGTLTVGCTPAALAGTLVLATNDPGQPVVSYPLSCVALVAQYAASLPSGSAMAIIGNSGSAASRTLTVRNIGPNGTTLNVSLNAVSAGYTLSGGPFSLASGATGTFTVGCTPVGAAGTLTLNSNDPNLPSATYALSCVTLQKMQFFPLPNPVRLLDTRSGPGVSGCDIGVGALPGGNVRTEPATGACTGIPATATAIFGNATAVSAGAGGFITLFPSNVANPPIAANVNYPPSGVVNTAFAVALGPDGAFKILSGSATDLVIDVTGYFAPPGTGGLYFHPLPSPVRLMDTRSGAGVSGCDIGVGKLPAGNTRTEVAVGTCTGVPSGAKAILGNSTAVAGPAGGYITLFPSSVGSPPTVANVNYPANGIVNNAFTVGLGADGAFKIFTGASPTDLVIDVTGYYDSNATGGLFFAPLPSPTRLLDTRSGPGVSGCDIAVGKLPGDSTRTESAANLCTDIPNTAAAILGNSTTVPPPTSAGYITLFPSDVGTVPTVANVNYPFGGIINNAYAVGLGPDGALKIFSGRSTTDLVVDISGAYLP